jgi:hypothetical protein
MKRFNFKNIRINQTFSNCSFWYDDMISFIIVDIEIVDVMINLGMPLFRLNNVEKINIENFLISNLTSNEIEII